ncbi:unnamed protein product, partial [marine sediment metagenome]
MFNVEDLQELHVTGTKVNYYVICKRKLWLFARHLTMEHSSDQVRLGKHLHERSYPRERHRELDIDGLIHIDMVGQRLREVKSSRKMLRAHRMQILFYLYYLKRLGVEGLEGEMNFPKERRKEVVRLDAEGKRQVEEAIEDIMRIEGMQSAPEAEFKT